MLISYNWLKDYVKVNSSPEELAHQLTMLGFADEGKDYQGEGISKVVTGKITEITKHPDADKLQICQLDVGDGEKLQIVTGAQNVKEGQTVPVALVGSHLPGGVKIKKGKLRGVPSLGMLCSGQELALDKKILPANQQNGILILPSDLPLGQDIKEAYQLNDVVFDLDVTGNRPDCLNMVGIAREVASLTGEKLNLPAADIAEDSSEKTSDCIKVTVEDTELCPRYSARVVKGIKVQESPLWLQRKIQSLGMRPINNIVDITNFILLELGQPLHAFDLNQVAGREIIVRHAAKGEKIVTLDEQERVLSEEMLVIADKSRAVAVAGVMGGLNSEVEETTTDVLIEAANFNAVSVRRTSKALGLRSEASSRYEKGLDPNLIDLALDRAASLMAELGGGRILSGKIDIYPKVRQPHTLALNPERIRMLIGAPVADEEIVKILNGLEIKVQKDGKAYQLTIPTFRQDLLREADIVEEIARIYGFANIPSARLSGAALPGGKTEFDRFTDKVREIMLSLGLNEAISYSFINSNWYDALRLSEDDSLRLSIPLANPLTEEQNVMRTTLVPGLLAAVATNLSRQVKDTALFEIGAVFLPESLPLSELPEEKLKLGAVLSSKAAKTLWGETAEADFFQLKGCLELLLEKLGVKNYRFVQDKAAYLHPGRTAVLYLNDEKAGLLGEVHPDTADSFEINQRAYIWEIDLNLLYQASDLLPVYNPLPKYPAINRDLALVAEEKTSAADITALIWQNGKKLLEDVVLFDVYQGDQVKAGCKSLAYSLTYRVADRTLTDEEVNQVQDKILAELQAKFGAELRG